MLDFLRGWFTGGLLGPRQSISEAEASDERYRLGLERANREQELRYEAGLFPPWNTGNPHRYEPSTTHSGSLPNHLVK